MSEIAIREKKNGDGTRWNEMRKGINGTGSVLKIQLNFYQELVVLVYFIDILLINCIKNI
jgi:hypothetical protein